MAILDSSMASLRAGALEKSTNSFWEVEVGGRSKPAVAKESKMEGAKMVEGSTEVAARSQYNPVVRAQQSFRKEEKFPPSNQQSSKTFNRGSIDIDSILAEGVEQCRRGKGLAEQRGRGEGLVEKQRQEEGLMEQRRRGEGLVGQQRRGEGLVEQRRRGEGLMEQQRRGQGLVEDRRRGEGLVEDRRREEGLVEEHRRGEGLVKWQKREGLGEHWRGEGLREHQRRGEGLREQQKGERYHHIL